MRLYNASSCTPVASNCGVKRWAPPLNFLPPSPPLTTAGDLASNSSKIKDTSPSLSKSTLVARNSTDLTATSDSHSGDEVIRRFCSAEDFRFDIERVQDLWNQVDEEEQELVECMTYASSSTLSSWSNSLDDSDSIVDTAVLNVESHSQRWRVDNSLWPPGNTSYQGEFNISPCLVSRHKLSTDSTSILFPSGGESVQNASSEPITEAPTHHLYQRIALFPVTPACVEQLDESFKTNEELTVETGPHEGDLPPDTIGMPEMLDESSWTTFRLPFTPIDIPSTPPKQTTVIASPKAKRASSLACQDFSMKEPMMTNVARKTADDVNSYASDENSTAYSHKTPLLNGHVQQELYVAQKSKQNVPKARKGLQESSKLRSYRIPYLSRPTSQGRTAKESVREKNDAICFCRGTRPFHCKTLRGLAEVDEDVLKIFSDVMNWVRFHRCVSLNQKNNLKSENEDTMPNVESFDTEEIRVGLALTTIGLAHNDIIHAISTMDETFISTELINAVFSAIELVPESCLHYPTGRHGLLEKYEGFLFRLHQIDPHHARLQVLRELCRVSDAHDELTKDLLLLRRTLEEIENSKTLRLAVGILLHLCNIENAEVQRHPSSKLVSRLREFVCRDRFVEKNVECDFLQCTFHVISQTHPRLAGLARDLPTTIDDVMGISWTKCGERMNSFDRAMRCLQNDVAMHGQSVESKVVDDLQVREFGRGFVRLCAKIRRLHDLYEATYEQIQRIMYYFGETGPEELALRSILELVSTICKLHY